MKPKKLFIVSLYFKHSMPSQKKTLSSLSEEERSLLHQLKNDLKMQDVPRDQWASIMQSEISKLRKSARKIKKSKKRDNPVIFAFKRLWKHVQRVIMKKMLKRQGSYNDDDIERMMKAMSGDIPSEMAMPNVIPDTKIEDAGKHGTFLTTSQDHTRKKVEVFFDDDDEDDENV